MDFEKAQILTCILLKGPYDVVALLATTFESVIPSVPEKFVCLFVTEVTHLNVSTGSRIVSYSKRGSF